MNDMKKGLFEMEETEEQKLQRLSEHAGRILNMFKAFFKTPKGIDIRRALVFTAALAGHACLQAVKANNGSFAVVETEDGKRFFFGDDLNRYLLEDRLSVVNFIFRCIGHITGRCPVNRCRLCKSSRNRSPFSMRICAEIAV